MLESKTTSTFMSTSRGVPLMYRTGILKPRVILLIWIVGFLTDLIGFLIHDLPLYLIPTQLLVKHFGLLLLFFIGHLIVKLIHGAMKNLFCLNLAEGQFTTLDNYPRQYKCELEDVFASQDHFDKYRYKQYVIFTRWTNNFLSLFVGFIIILWTQLSSRTTKDVLVTIGDQNNPVPADDPYFLFVAIVHTFTQTLLMTGLLSGLFVLRGFVQSTWKIGEEQESLFKGSDYVRKYSQKQGSYESNYDNSKALLQRSELSHFAIRHFRRKCSAIPRELLPITMLIFLLILISGFLSFYFIILQGGNFLVETILKLILLSFVILDLYVFFLPQYSLHSMIKSRKKITLDFLENHYESKKIFWLSLGDNADKDVKQSTWQEIKTLSNFIEEIEALPSWPFDYSQVGTLIISGFIAILLLLDVFNFIKIVERLV